MPCENLEDMRPKTAAPDKTDVVECTLPGLTAADMILPQGRKERAAHPTHHFTGQQMLCLTPLPEPVSLPIRWQCVGEIKKQRYVYYHCTRFRGKCLEPYVREEVLERQFSELLGQLTFDNEIPAWVRDALRGNQADEEREHVAAIERLQSEYNRLPGRIDAMYVDKLDGRIDAGFFDRMSAQWCDEQARCLRDIERHQNANQSYLDEGIHLLELAQTVQRLFERQDAREKPALARFPSFELLVERWRTGRQIQATL